MGTVLKNKGGMKAWTTEEQKKWLTDNLAAYVASRSTNAPAEFWPPIYEDWFAKWPVTVAEGETGDKEELLASGMQKRKDQIRYWFKNHKGSSTSSGTGRSRVLDLTGKHSKVRKLSAAHAYSKLYFKTKIKPVIQERWRKDYLKKNPGQSAAKLPPYPIEFQTTILHELWDAEPEDVKSDVRRQFGLDRDSSDEAGVEEEVPPDGDEAERHRVTRAQEYQNNIDNLNRTMLTALAEVESKTGLIGTILLAGPEPAQGGNISVFEYHRGRSQYADKDFGRVYRHYADNVLKPFHDFASRIFPPAARMAMALPGTEQLMNYLHSKDDDPQPQISIGASDQTDIRTSDRLRSQTEKSKASKSATSSHRSAATTLSELDDSESDRNDSDSESLETTLDVVETPPRNPQPRSAYERQRLANIERNKELLKDVQEAYVDLMNDMNTRATVKKTKKAPGNRRGMDNFSRSLTEQISKSAQQADTDDPGDNPSSSTACGSGGTDGATNNHGDNPSSSTACGPASSDGATDDHGSNTSLSTASGPTSTDSATDDCGDNPSLSTASGPASGDGDVVVQDATASLTVNADVITDTDPDIQHVSSTLVMSEGIDGGGNVPDPSEDNRSAWPKWMKKHIPMIEGGPGTKEFQLVLNKFLMLEALLGYPEGKGRENVLLNVNRPEEIGRWIANGRKGSPTIENLPRYVASWKKWWMSLQPESRQRKLVRAVSAGEKWEELRKGSINGFFNVIISLVWWYSVIKNPSQSKVHREMVEDVSWVLDWMLDNRQEGKKRATGTSGGDHQEGKKCAAPSGTSRDKNSEPRIKRARTK